LREHKEAEYPGGDYFVDPGLELGNFFSTPQIFHNHQPDGGKSQHRKRLGHVYFQGAITVKP